MATWLHGAGYQTALMGKYLNGYKYADIIPPGWDRWFVSTTDDRGGFEYYNYTMSDQGTSVFYGSDPQDYSTDVLSGQADSWIRGADPSKPMFLELSTAAPHSPATPGPKYINAFNDLAPYRPPSFNELDASDKPQWVQQTALMNGTDIATTDAFRKDMYRTLLSVDDMVTTVVQALAATGRLSNTMIVLAGDNGYSWGEHRRWDRKSSPYENDTRVPMVIRYDPLTATASHDQHLVTNLDWAPTFADLAGTSAPGADGTSLLPLLRGDQTTWRTDFGVEHLQGLGDDIQSYCQVRNDTGFSYTKYATGEEELYDLNADPYQLSNAVTDPSYATVLAQLRTRAPQICNPPPPDMTFNTTPPVVSISAGPDSVTTSTSASFTFGASHSSTFQCEIDGVVPKTCTSPKTYTGLAAGPHFFSVIAKDANGFLGETSWHWAVAMPVTVRDFRFVPATARPGQGVNVLWSFTGPSNHTVTDMSGLGLFDSGPEPPGSTFAYLFTAAGTYSYHCTIHPSMQGQAKVPLLISPITGSVTTPFSIVWASVSAPAGLIYNVQVRRPGSSTWANWFSGTSPSQSFTPDAGVGTYSFRARVKSSSGPTAIGWSTVKSITVS